jgi:hypothetical protein
MASLKPLKSVAHNLAHQFASTTNHWAGDYGISHLARAARAVGGRVHFDLLAVASVPALTGEGATIARQLAAGLGDLLRQERLPPDLLRGASAEYHFATSRPDPPGGVAFDCVMRLEATGGRCYAVPTSERNSP